MTVNDANVRRDIHLIGAGRLAKGVMHLLADEPGGWRLAVVCARRLAQAQALAASCGGQAIAEWRALMASSPRFLLLAVSDDAVADVARTLAANATGRAPEGALALHCSGSLPAEVLAPLRQLGYQLVSLHPAFSFADPENTVARFAGTVCAIEGDDDATALAESLARAWGGEPVRLDANGKRLYHAATVMANNLNVALLDAATQAANQAGLSGEQAQRLLQPLAEQAVANFFQYGGNTALTGPLSRGDAAVVEGHLEALEDGPANLASIYRALSQQALKLSAEQAVLSPDQMARLAKALASGH
jgi:predicted short-subunit dehydrogenase-like oxidoreductase (DUF2520 family)